MPIKLLFCYAHEDESLLNKLKMHLTPLQRQGFISTWHDRDISAGTEWEQEIKEHLNTADIILLLVSPDFMASDYCYGIEMQRAIERHEQGEARVIPVILRPVYWQGSLGRLQALPKDGKPVKSRYWHNMEEALSDISQGIRKTIDTLPKGFISSKEEISPILHRIKLIQHKVEQDNKNDLNGTKIFSREEVEEALRQRLSNDPTHRLPEDYWQSSGTGTLYIKIGKEPGRAYEIKSSLSIGRNSKSDIFLEDFSASREHASVSVDTDGHYILMDLGSSNGTIVNNKILKKNETHFLYEDDEIQIGHTILLFKRAINN